MFTVVVVSVSLIVSAISLIVSAVTSVMTVMMVMTMGTQEKALVNFFTIRTGNRCDTIDGSGKFDG